MKTNSIAENVLGREFKQNGPRAVLMTDITYIPAKEGFCYLCTVLDGYTKQILSYTLSESLRLDFVLETINKLVEVHGIDLNEKTIIHSDQGSHYTSYRSIELVNDIGLRQSMSRRGNCWDNAPQESFYGHMKNEIQLSKNAVFEEIRTIIDNWMDYYNNYRYQWQLGKLSPNEYYDFIKTGYSPVSHMKP